MTDHAARALRWANTGLVCVLIAVLMPFLTGTKREQFRQSIPGTYKVSKGTVKRNAVIGAGVGAAVGAGAGAATASVLGGMGLALCGTGVGIGPGVLMLIGAGIVGGTGAIIGVVSGKPSKAVKSADTYSTETRTVSYRLIPSWVCILTLLIGIGCGLRALYLFIGPFRRIANQPGKEANNVKYQPSPEDIEVKPQTKELSSTKELPQSRNRPNAPLA